MWPGALRNPEDPLRAALANAIEDDGQIRFELLYSDLTARQRALTRFGLLPASHRADADAQDQGRRYTTMSRLWFLAIDGPRPDSDDRINAIATVQAETGNIPESQGLPS